MHAFRYQTLFNKDLQISCYQVLIIISGSQKLNHGKSHLTPNPSKINQMRTCSYSTLFGKMNTKVEVEKKCFSSVSVRYYNEILTGRNWSRQPTLCQAQRMKF